MCGIVGLFIKNPDLEAELGVHLSRMLIEMTERGPDSAGVAIYRNPVGEGRSKFTLLADTAEYDWDGLSNDVKAEFSGQPKVEVHLNHASFTVNADADATQAWLAEKHPELRVNSSGQVIEIYKEKGLPADFIRNFEIEKMQGTHALGHTRMATESAITTIASHPFSTGQDLCLVHNGSLSNHNRLREKLRKYGIKIQTENDTEVAAGYLSWRMREGDTLDEALQYAIDDLDGFYTFAVGTRDGFAVMRDPIGCKPAVMAETDDWAAMSSEFRAIAVLPGADSAKIWEPEPTKIYSWKRG